jgi:hypothetical protein
MCRTRGETTTTFSASAECADSIMAGFGHAIINDGVASRFPARRALLLSYKWLDLSIMLILRGAGNILRVEYKILRAAAALYGRMQTRPGEHRKFVFMCVNCKDPEKPF